MRRTGVFAFPTAHVEPHFALGWERGQRVYCPVFHLDIKDGKIWVQEDATDFDLVGELERRGVPRTDIVLGFQEPGQGVLGDRPRSSASGYRHWCVAERLPFLSHNL